MTITPQELEKLRIKAGFGSKTEAARVMGVGRVTYQRWVAGTQKIPEIAENYLRLLIEKNALDAKRQELLALPRLKSDKNLIK